MNNTRTVSEISVTAAQITRFAVLGFLLLLIVLHFIKPEFDPSWRMISEYAIGDFGWMMMLAFLLWALSFVSLFFAIRSQISGVVGKIGLAALCISAAGLVLGAIFVTDPVTINKEDMTTSGMLHSLGGTLGMAMPLATILLTWSLCKSPNWGSERKAILWSGILTVVGFLVSFLSLAVILSQSNGVFSPDTKVGFPMRFEVLTYCIWLIVVAQKSIKLNDAR